MLLPTLIVGSVMLTCCFLGHRSSGTSTTPTTPSAGPRQPSPHVSNPPRTPKGHQPKAKVWHHRPAITTPEERDPNLREFLIVDPEGEVHEVDTSQKGNDFYGPVWTRICSAIVQEDELLRGRAVLRRRAAADNRFSGYDVLIDGVSAFLPRSLAGHFYDENLDATGRCLAVKVRSFNPAGKFKGKLIVEARTPLQLLAKINKQQGNRWALAVDVSQGAMAFLRPRGRVLWCPLDQVCAQARRQQLPDDPLLLTGLYAQMDWSEGSSLAQVRSFCA